MSIFMKPKEVTLLLVASLMLTLTACGGKSTSSALPTMEKLEIADEVDGFYQAKLSPLNKSAAGSTIGTITIRMRGDEIVVDSNILGAPAGTKHLQFITTGAECPGPSADTNFDGIIDAVEGSLVYGKAIIPLDNDLNSQVEGLDFEPIANSAGAFDYRRSASLSLLISDLSSTDPAPRDYMVKLQAEEKLILTGKRVVIFGVSTKLPSTASGFNELTAKEGLPIACGELLQFYQEELMP